MVFFVLIVFFFWCAGSVSSHFVTKSRVVDAKDRSNNGLRTSLPYVPSFGRLSIAEHCHSFYSRDIESCVSYTVWCASTAYQHISILV